MPGKIRKTVKTVKTHAPKVIAGAALVYGTYHFTRQHTLEQVQGKHISRADFERLNNGNQDLILVTPIGEFRVTPN